MSTNRVDPAREAMPLPWAQFRRFLILFHVVFILGLVFSLVLRWRRPGFTWGVADYWLVALVGLQVALYLLFFVFLWKVPTVVNWWLAYFAAGYGIWLVEWQLEAGLQWTAWAYLGQMFGVLRPRLSIPISLVVFAVFFGKVFGLRPASGWELAGAVSLAVTVSALGLFLNRLTVTSIERGELIRELEAAKGQLELAREKDAELAALRERERLARDLHDSLGHGLVTLTVQLEAVQRLVTVDPIRAAAMIDGMKELTRTSMEEVRRSLAGLRAPGLGERPLRSALEELCRDTGKEGLRVECRLGAGSDRLTPAVGETLWRVAQEGLHNVVRHARARTAEVSLELQPAEAVLAVSDDGVGLPPDVQGREGHYGLRGLRERVEGLGGRLAIASGSSGTRLEARLPLVS